MANYKTIIETEDLNNLLSFVYDKREWPYLEENFSNNNSIALKTRLLQWSKRYAGINRLNSEQIMEYLQWNILTEKE